MPGQNPFHAEQSTHLLSTVNVVAKEEVVRLRGEATVLKHAEQVVVLAVRVTADAQRRLELQQDGLGEEHLARLDAQAANLSLRQVHYVQGREEDGEGVGR